MISRTRLIITALVACHLFLQPGLLTSQLRPSSSEGISEQQGPSAGSIRTGPESRELPAKTNPLSTLRRRRTKTAPQASEITVITDSGQRDQKTEQIIQQELEAGSNQELGPPRPAINVPLGPNEVLIRADEQEKNQDIYHVRGHVEIRFRTYILHCDQATYDSTTGLITATGPRGLRWRPPQRAHGGNSRHL